MRVVVVVWILFGLFHSFLSKRTEVLMLWQSAWPFVSVSDSRFGSGTPLLNSYSTLIHLSFYCYCRLCSPSQRPTCRQSVAAVVRPAATRESHSGIIGVTKGKHRVALVSNGCYSGSGPLCHRHRLRLGYDEPTVAFGNAFVL